MVLGEGDADREAKAHIVSLRDRTGNFAAGVGGTRIALACAVFKVEERHLVGLPPGHIIEHHGLGAAVGPHKLESVDKEAEVLRLNRCRRHAKLLVELPAAPRQVAHYRRELDGDRLGRDGARCILFAAGPKAGGGHNRESG